MHKSSFIYVSVQRVNFMELEIKYTPKIDIDTANALWPLTNKRGSLMKVWLARYRNEVEASLVCKNGELIGWAGIYFVEDVMGLEEIFNRIIGVYISPIHRRNGYANKAIEHLLNNMTKYPNSVIFHSVDGFKNKLFRSAITKHGLLSGGDDYA